MGRKKNIAKTPNRKNSRDDKFTRISEDRERYKHTSLMLGSLFSPHHANMATEHLVEEAGSPEDRLDRHRAARRPEPNRMGISEQASNVLDSIFNTDKARLWAPRTHEEYKRIMTKFVEWVFGHDRNALPQEEIKKESLLKTHARGIFGYLGCLTVNASGETVNMAGKISLQVLGPFKSREELEQGRCKLKLLRRDANIRNPPICQPADALELSDLIKIWKKISGIKLDLQEMLAVEILTVAFVTTSRVAEIERLKMKEVAEDRSWISIRAKTFAETCVRHIKHVRDGHSLWPTIILKERRARACLLSKSVIFSTDEDGDRIMSSSGVTGALKKVLKKIKMHVRVTSHSGRKDAAVTALISGVPVSVIQAFGLWKCQDSLQSYLGKAVREKYCMLDLIR